MKNRTLTLFCLVAFSAGTTAMADKMMDTAQLSALITGNTLYVEIPAGAPGAPDGGTAPIYYATDGSAAAQLPGGPKLVGTWALEEGRYCIDWDNGPQNSCTQLLRGNDGFIVMDATLNKPRGIITRITTGNSEDL
ncbi:hypothetical protein [Qingshengfaniella alkalisoli]|uniref:hypothetical protein n=1 Tax=Qingshengfaniella alkalisoli TaxID=2599296 RepID=UPI00143D7F0A|nr:hypothetical protein [Qingshengfaniella alkalisoli]